MYEKSSKRSHFKMELELPPRRNCLVGLNSSDFQMLKLGLVTFGLSLKQPASQTTVCEDNKTTDIMATGLKMKGII